MDVEISTTKSSQRESNEGTLKIITGVNGLSGADIVTRCAVDDEHGGVEVGKQLDACSWVLALRDRVSLILRRLMLIPSTRTVDTVLQKQLLRLSPVNRNKSEQGKGAYLRALFVEESNVMSIYTPLLENFAPVMSGGGIATLDEKMVTLVDT